MIRLLTILIFALSFTVNAQSIIKPDPCPPSDMFVKPPVVYPYVREADVMWAKRVWRTIDMREKLNQPLYYPLEPSQCRMSLFDVIKQGLRSGELTAYDRPVLDDEFNYPMTLPMVEEVITKRDTIYIELLDNTGVMEPRIIVQEIGSGEVLRYWVKEDWFFDKQRGIMDVRIIGICPLIEKIDKLTGEFRGYQPLFWLYYNQCRPVFAKHGVLYHQENTGAMPSMDNVFQKRIFSSFIHKESNVFDRWIIEYASGTDALLESDRIKNELFEMEHDMWHY